MAQHPRRKIACIHVCIKISTVCFDLVFVLIAFSHSFSAGWIDSDITCRVWSDIQSWFDDDCMASECTQ